VDDCGGGYSESIAEMCDELQNGSLSLLIVTPNGRDESGANRDCFLLNPMLKTPLHQNMFKFLGKLYDDFILILGGFHHIMTCPSVCLICLR
jgi:E3 ubiquitin-protein ligase HERC2